MKLRDLQPGMRVLADDGRVWTIASVSYIGPYVGADKKWLWLRDGNEYRKLRGSAALAALRRVRDLDADAFRRVRQVIRPTGKALARRLLGRETGEAP